MSHACAHRAVRLCSLCQHGTTHTFQCRICDVSVCRHLYCHFCKYEALSRSVPDSAVPFSREAILGALKNGDIHLNTLSLATWDRAAGFIMRRAFQSERVINACNDWHGTPRTLSLAERVCILKHIAKYRIAEWRTEE